MNIKYSLNNDDYINFNLYRLKDDEKGQEMVKKQRLFGSISLMLFGAVLVYFAKTGKLIISLIVVGFSTFWYINYPNLAKKRIIKSTTKALSNQNTSDFFRELNITISEDSIQEGDLKFSWDQVTRSVDSKEAFYFFFDDNTSLIVPKRVIDNVEDCKKLVEASSHNYICV